MSWQTHVLGSGEQQLEIPGFELKVVRGADKGKVFAATTSEVTIGSHAACDLLLSDTAVSGSHLSLEIRPQGLRVVDLRSTNGTFVSGVRVMDAYVASGAEIEVGQSVLRVSLKGPSVTVPLAAGDRFGELLGKSTAMRQVFARLERSAQNDATVLIQGESGTGKDLAAEAIHQASARAQASFVVVDCSAIPAALMESELFGHERGSFTGAVGKHVGAFESAHRGTLFLDEIGELPLDMQPKLLRALEKRIVKPVGSSTSKEVDIRVIAATNRDLRAEVNGGRFREDLFFRLSVIGIRMPALRDRDGDAAFLAETFFRKLAGDIQMPRDLRARLQTYDWPGNVRELRNAVEQAVVFGDLDGDSLATPRAASPAGGVVPFKEAKQRVIVAFEKPYLEALLQTAQGNVSAAARLADLDRVHLIKLLRQHGLRP